MGGSILTLQSGAIDAATLPVTLFNEGGVSYVVPTEAAPAMITRFKEGQPLTAG